MTSIHVFALALLCLSGGYSANADQDNQSEDWTCSETVLDRSGTLDSFGRCRGKSATPISCYEDIQKKCSDSISGVTKSVKYRRFSDKCVTSFSECW